MPLRTDPRLWWNLPGVVAAYQPVKCPGGSLLARVNMAHGGDNRYQATSPRPPAFNAVSGWRFVATSTQYLATGVVPVNDQTWTMVCWVTAGTFAAGSSLMGMITVAGANPRIALALGYGAGFSHPMYGNGGYLISALTNANGVVAVSGAQGYLNGVPDGAAIAPAAGSFAIDIYIGARHRSDQGNPDEYLTATIGAAAIYARTLSAAAVWSVSRQMQYCDTNPDWSAWSPQRRWWFMAEAIAASGRAYNPVYDGRGVIGSNVVQGRRLWQ